MPDPVVDDQSVSADPFECKYHIGGCQRPVLGICPTCHDPFCEAHASEFDTAYCSDCLNSTTAAVTKEPLIDTEGVTHAGSHITPTGPAYKTTAQRIVDMDDHQLGMHIEWQKQRKKDMEAALEYMRIDISTAELEQEERQEKLRKKLRGTKVPQAVATATGTKIGVGGNNSKSKAPQDPILALAQAMKVPPERAMEFFAALAKASKEAKEKKGIK